MVKFFVANRVTKLQDNTKGFTWYHVKTAENQADILSCGFLRKYVILTCGRLGQNLNSKIVDHAIQTVPHPDLEKTENNKSNCNALKSRIFLEAWFTKSANSPLNEVPAE